MLNQTLITSLTAGVLLSASCLLGCDNFCPQPECPGGLSVAGSLDLDAEQEAHLQIVACRNTECSTGFIDTANTSATGNAYPADMNGDALFSCSAKRGGDMSWQLSGSFWTHDDEAFFNDDDIFTLKISDIDTNTVLVDIQQSVAFEEYGGGSCVGSCQRGNLSFP